VVGADAADEFIPDAKENMDLLVVVDPDVADDVDAEDDDVAPLLDDSLCPCPIDALLAAVLVR